jgi:hypothetical protein
MNKNYSIISKLTYVPPYPCNIFLLLVFVLIILFIRVMHQSHEFPELVVSAQLTFLKFALDQHAKLLEGLGTPFQLTLAGDRKGHDHVEKFDP